MLTPAMAILAMQLARTSIGVADASRDGQLCVAMPAPSLAPGSTVTMIRPDAPQSAVAVTIVRPIPTCERLERAMIPGPYYLATRAASTLSDSGTLWVAFSGRVATRSASAGALAAQLDSTSPNAQVRSCTSNEGLHLTVWSGAPLTSQRLWHQYFYLGYDVEPSCDERDVRDGAA